MINKVDDYLKLRKPFYHYNVTVSDPFNEHYGKVFQRRVVIEDVRESINGNSYIKFSVVNHNEDVYLPGNYNEYVIISELGIFIELLEDFVHNETNYIETVDQCGIYE